MQRTLRLSDGDGEDDGDDDDDDYGDGVGDGARGYWIDLEKSRFEIIGHTD